MSEETVVSNASELQEALAVGAGEIRVVGVIAGMPMITLPPGTALRGGVLRFGAKGIRLTKDNVLDGVTVVTASHEVAVLNDTGIPDAGTLTLRDVKASGQVLLLAEGALRTVHVVAENVHVDTADLRGRVARPRGFGVEAMQGAFTLWNRHQDRVEITAELRNVSAGSSERPVRGTGVFVGGHGDWNGAPDGGTVRVSELTTGDIHTDGGIAEATPDLISGGVFVITGADVDTVVCKGTVTTYGQNDMVLDNWGTVKHWRALAPITSHGPSGIGFVNFGALDSLDVTAPIVTTGKGARGFNLYDGSLAEARFTRIATSGDGSVGVQISKPMGRLIVTEDITTSGGEGLSLVKGVQLPLKAVALSIKEGGIVDSISIGGRLATSGAHVTTLEVAGAVAAFDAGGGIEATGSGSTAVEITGSIDLAGTVVRDPE